MSNACPECRHILTSGRKCHQPALRGKPFCIHHCRTRNLVEANRARRHSISLPPLEDRHAVQMSIDVVLAALAAGKINRRTAGTYAYAIKIVSDNFPQMEKELPLAPIEICRTGHGDILADAPDPSHLGTGETMNAECPTRENAAPCPIHATASPSHELETTTSESTAVTLIDKSAGAPDPSHFGTGETMNAECPTRENAARCPIHATASPSHELETTTSESTAVTLSDNSAGAPGPSHEGTGKRINADSTEPSLHDLRNTSASHEYDPEPPARPGKTELRQKRRQIEQYLRQQREALSYWSTLPPEQRKNENPQLVINSIQQTIEKCETELKEITKLQTPDPEQPDPPL